MKEIKAIARVKFLPGKREEWNRLTAEAMDIVRTTFALSDEAAG